jgi:hypothetical protein
VCVCVCVCVSVCVCVCWGGRGEKRTSVKDVDAIIDTFMLMCSTV